MAYPVARQHGGISGGFCAVSNSRLDWTGYPYSFNIRFIKCHFNQTNSKASYAGIQLSSQSFFIGERYLEHRRQPKWSYQGKGLGFVIQAAVEGGAANTPEGSKASEVDNNELKTSIYEQSSSVDNIASLRAALAATEAKIYAAEREKAETLEALSKAEAKQQEYAERIVQTTEAAMRDIESALAEFDEEMERILEEKLAVESELILTKQDAINLAVKVEKLAESAIQGASGNLAKEAALMIAGAETSVAEASAKVEERIHIAIIDASNSVIGESRDGIEKSLLALEASKEKAQKMEVDLFHKMQILDNLVLKEASALGSQRDVSILQHKLWVVNNENEQLCAEIKALMERVKYSEEHAAAANAALLQSQEAARKNAQGYEEKARKALEDLKNAEKVKLESVRTAFKADIETIQAAVRSVQKSGKSQEEADLRRCEALERSLAAAEATANAWKEHSLVVEDLFRKVKEKGIETVEVGGAMEDILNGGRIALFLCSDSRRKDLLVDSGPRTGTPDWMLRRTKVVWQGLPPGKRSQEGLELEAHLKLPRPEDVWSIMSAKMKEDVFTKQAAEREAMDKQRIDLEHALERKMVRKSKEAEMKIESGTGSGQEIVFQGFNWESWRRKYYLELAPKAADLANCGITTIWFPPPTHSITPQGYMPGDLYDLNSAYGMVEELKSCIEEMHNHDLMVLGDVILNHRCAEKQSPNGIWNIFGGKLPWGPEAIARDDPNFQGCGNLSSGENYHAAPHIDHSQDFVRRDIKGWLNWLRKEIGFDGWRLDFVRGFWGGYVKEYIEATNPAFVVGEYWDSLVYEGGNVCYNQDAHRQRIVNWINATAGTSSAFDVTTKGILHAALHNEYWRLIDPQGKPPGVMGWWPSRAMTFLENHDTGSTQGHWPFPREKLLQGYAYILTHPGTPMIFYDHFYDFGLRDSISELISVRTQTGVHCHSPIRIYEATNQGYAAQIGDNLIMKIGPSEWNPFRKNNLAGNWCRVLDKGLDYQVWRKP